MKTANNGAQYHVMRPDMNPDNKLDPDELLEDRAPSMYLNSIMYKAFAMESTYSDSSTCNKLVSIQMQCMEHLHLINELTESCRQQDKKSRQFEPEQFEELSHFISGIGVSTGEVIQAMRLSGAHGTCAATIQAAESDQVLSAADKPKQKPVNAGPDSRVDDLESLVRLNDISLIKTQTIMDQLESSNDKYMQVIAGDVDQLRDYIGEFDAACEYFATAHGSDTTGQDTIAENHLFKASPPFNGLPNDLIGGLTTQALAPLKALSCSLAIRLNDSGNILDLLWGTRSLLTMVSDSLKHINLSGGKQ